MSMRDQDGKGLIQPSYQREQRAHEDVWAVYRFTPGLHDAERVTDYMALYPAREQARKQNEEIRGGADTIS